jgi:phosphoglycolate phosphatase-like HAD superfamily hydrolase
MADSKLPKAAIFDLDGTPLDSVDLYALAWRESVREEFVKNCRAWTAASSSSIKPIAEMVAVARSTTLVRPPRQKRQLVSLAD